MKSMVLALVVLAVTMARADEAEHRRLAEQALSLMDVQKNIEHSFETVKNMQIAQLKNMNLSASDTEKTRAMQDEIMSLIQREFTWDKVKDDYIQIYSETFTEDELKGLIAFYQSPTGRTFTEKMPALMQRSMAISQKQMMTVMPKIQELSKKFAAQQKPALAPKAFIPPPAP